MVSARANVYVSGGEPLSLILLVSPVACLLPSVWRTPLSRSELQLIKYLVGFDHVTNINDYSYCSHSAPTKHLPRRSRYRMPPPFLETLHAQRHLAQQKSFSKHCHILSPVRTEAFFWLRQHPYDVELFSYSQRARDASQAQACDL